MTKKTGILGGTFDPIHKGHLMIAEEAMKELGLDEVIFIPTAQTPLKDDVPITPEEHRLRMVSIAITDYPGFRLSTIEINRAGTSYTVDTLRKLKEELGDGDELYFIIGLDSLETLPRWKEPERLVKMCRLVTIKRPGYEMPGVIELEKLIPGLSDSLIVLDRESKEKGIRQTIGIRSRYPLPLINGRYKPRLGSS